METSDIIKKHEKDFVKARRMIRFLLVFVIAVIIALQWENISYIFNHLFNKK